MGSFDLDLEGWEKLTKDQRDRLAEILRIGAQKANDAVPSRPVDPDHLAAQLQKIADNQDALPRALPRPSHRSRSPTVDVDWDEEQKKSETTAYHTLVNEGGLPAYPIDLLEEISKDPVEHRDILRPWQDNPDVSTPDWDVFQKQMWRWQNFRIWQKENRNIIDNDAEYLAYVERRKRDYLRWQDLEGLAELEADPSIIKHTWYYKERDRLRDFWYLRENHGRGGFPEYFEEVKRRLARHGFTRTFHLDEDPQRQDKLTTWIEYLNYEYSWYDRYSRDVERLQPQHDEAWQKLVDSGVLKPSETEEYLRSDESGLRDENEEDAARKAVESAKSAARAALISTQNEPQRSSLTKPVRLQMMRKAHARLDAAKESLSAIRKRGDLITNFVRGTFDYKAAQRNVKSQNIRLQWILEQVPQIEAEVNESKAAEGSSNAERGTKRRPRRDQEDEVATERKPTKRRRNEQSLHLDGRTGSTAQTKGRSKRSHRNDTVDDEPPPKRFRVGSRDSGFQRQASGDADATSTGDRQASGVCASGRQGGGKATMKTRLAPSTPLPQPTDRPQLPLIGVESQSKTTESSSYGPKRRKKGLEHRRDEIIKDRSPKRQRREALDECGHDGTVDDKTLSKRYKNGRQPRRSHLQTPDEAETATMGRSQEPRIPAESKDIGKHESGHQAATPLRRSARIATRQKPCKSPVVPSGSQEPGQWSRRKARQAPTPPSSTGSQDRWSRSQAKTTSKRILARGIK